MSLLLAESVHGVEKAEIRIVQQAGMFVEGQLLKEAGLSTTIWGIPSGSDFFKPLIVAGRWLAPEDGHARRDSPARRLRKTISTQVIWLLLILAYGARIIGRWSGFMSRYLSAGLRPTIYAPRKRYSRSAKKYNQASRVLIRTTSHEGAFTTEVTKNLRKHWNGTILEFPPARPRRICELPTNGSSVLSHRCCSPCPSSWHLLARLP